MTKGRTKWTYFLTHVPNILPNFVIESMEKAEKGYKFEFEDDPGYVLGDVSCIPANAARFLEDSVDDLLSIALFGEWTKMRKKDARMVASLGIRTWSFFSSQSSNDP